MNVPCRSILEVFDKVLLKVISRQDILYSNELYYSPCYFHPMPQHVLRGHGLYLGLSFILTRWLLAKLMCLICVEQLLRL